VSPQLASRAQEPQWSWSVHRLDRLRSREFARRLALGQTDLEAWGAVVTDATIGYRRYRGAASVDAGKLARTLAAFLRRVDSAEMERTLHSCRAVARDLAPKALARIEALVAGDFGEGRVHMKRHGEETVEEVSIDAAAASVQLQASRVVLEAVRFIDKRQPASQVNVQTNVAVSTEGGALGRLRARRRSQGSES